MNIEDKENTSQKEECKKYERDEDEIAERSNTTLKTNEIVLKEENKSDEPRKHHTYRLYATLAFIAVVVAIGIPMWWKTTEVFRVRLPSSAITNMHNEAIKIKLKVGIYTFSDDRGKLLVAELKELYANHELWQIEWEHISSFDEAKLMNTPAALESYLLKQVNILHGDFLFIEWLKMEEDILITNDRTALIKENCSSKKISQALNLYILQMHRIQQIFSKDPKLSIKTEAPQASYDVIVSVLNPRPDIMDIKWHVSFAAESYLKPYLEQVSHISNYTIKTQWKFQLQFESDLKQIRDNSNLGRYYILTENSLPHIITAIEKNLGTGITNRTPINLIVYAIPCDIAPVYIASNNEKNENLKKSINGFISSKWGGVIIVNPPIEKCEQYHANSEKISFFIQTNDVMQIMLYQLQKILDISIEATMKDVKILELSELSPRKWEYEAYLRRSAIMHIVTTTNTLQSLIKLLDTISYIVINENVGALVNTAYQKISLAKAALSKNDLLEASTLAQTAFVASEQAFYDASLLAQLYFPDEQKYAIYIPLFLPIMVPVITSFSTIWKLVKNRRSIKKQK